MPFGISEVQAEHTASYRQEPDGAGDAVGVPAGIVPHVWAEHDHNTKGLHELEQKGIVKAQAGKGVFITCDLRYEQHCGRILLLDLDAPERLLPQLELTIMREKMNSLGYAYEMVSCGDRPTPFIIEKIDDSMGILATGMISEAWKVFLTC